MIEGSDYISNMQELVDLNEFMDDPEFEAALQLATKCIAKPDLPPAHAKRALVLMQAYAFNFRVKGQAYMTIKKGPGGSDENHKKNIYNENLTALIADDAGLSAEDRRDHLVGGAVA